MVEIVLFLVQFLLIVLVSCLLRDLRRLEKGAEDLQAQNIVLSDILNRQLADVDAFKTAFRALNSNQVDVEKRVEILEFDAKGKE